MIIIAFISALEYILIGLLLLLWYISFKKYDDSNCLGILIVLCRRSKNFKWLSWNIWGRINNKYYDDLERKMLKV